MQFATLVAAAHDLCVGLGGVLIGNGVVDINQTNYAWFEAGYTHSLVNESTWRGMQRECDFTKDLGIDGNGCPRGVSLVCAGLVNDWMVQSGVQSNRLSLYDYYADTCPTGGDHFVNESYGKRLGGVGVDPCSDDHTEAYLNTPAVRFSLHVSRSAPAKWSPCSDAVNNAYSCPDTLVSVVPLYMQLLQEGHRLLVYSGDVDGVVPTLASRRWIAGVCLGVARYLPMCCMG